MSTAHQLVVDDDPHTHARADSDEHRRRNAPRETEPLLADGRQVDVVLDEHTQVEPVAHDLERIEPATGSYVVRKRRYPAACLIHYPGHRDSQRQRPTVDGAGLFDHLADHLEDLHPDGSAAALGGPLLQIAERLAEQVCRSDPDVTPADVATDNKPRLRADDVCDRLAPPLSCAPARLRERAHLVRAG